jgi:hypothetical protein
MLDVWNACEAAGVKPPESVGKFFNWEKPEPSGILVNIDSMFDVQVKRLHEYKRQTLFILFAISEYLKLREDPNAAITPRTFIFSGKAAPSYFMAKLITVELMKQDAMQGALQGSAKGASQDLPQDLSQNLETGASQGDWVVNEERLEGFDLNIEALIIRTKPNDHSKTNRQYSGTNFPYLTLGAMQRIVDAGVQHLLIDLPSVDREEDGGALAAHHLFWNVPAEPNFQKTITELIYVPNEISDGNYILNLQVSNFANDAAPSRPMLFDLVEQ